MTIQRSITVKQDIYETLESLKTDPEMTIDQVIRQILDCHYVLEHFGGRDEK